MIWGIRKTDVIGEVRSRQADVIPESTAEFMGKMRFIQVLPDVLISCSSPDSGRGNASESLSPSECRALLNGTLGLESPLEVSTDDRVNCLFAEITPRWLHELQSCKEDFPENGRLIYSAVTMIIQYLLPTITISVAYYQASAARSVLYSRWELSPSSCTS